MKIISFAWTTQAFLDGKKDMTRRKWKDEYAKKFKKGEICAAYDRSPRFDGAFIGFIRLTKAPYKQKLRDMPESDLQREGGLWESKEEFIQLFGGDPEFAPWVVEFKRVAGPLKAEMGQKGWCTDMRNN